MPSEQTFDLIIGGDYHDGARKHRIAGRLLLSPRAPRTSILHVTLDDGRHAELLLDEGCTLGGLYRELSDLLRPARPATAGYCGGEDAPGPSTAPS